MVGMGRSEWDAEYDVVVAGFGYSGGIAALTAAGDGCKTIILEKGLHPGGNSILSGGSCVYAAEESSVLAYLRATCEGATDDGVLRGMARGMVELPNLVAKLAENVGYDIEPHDADGGAYPFPGAEGLRWLRVTRPERFKGFDWVTGARAGATLFAVVLENVARQMAIEVSYSSPVRRLITEKGRVIGCEVEKGGRVQYLRARRGVVLCTGGFEHDGNLVRQFVSTVPITSIGPTGNTGDGIRLGQSVGGALWHMWHVHGSYGLRIPGLPVGIRHGMVGPRHRDRPMPWIVVSDEGRRFMNEYPPAPQDTPIRDLLRYDPDRQRPYYTPAYLIVDDHGRSSGPIGRPAMTDPSIAYSWSEDNLAEVHAGYIRTASNVSEVAEVIGADLRCVRETLDEWNEVCRGGQADIYGRPDWSMMPLLQPPFYIIPVGPTITNTQGGLVHDVRQRVVNGFGEPIPGLYKAGENGSIFGHLYLLGGNNSECLIGGQLAGQNVAADKGN